MVEKKEVSFPLPRRYVPVGNAFFSSYSVSSIFHFEDVIKDSLLES